MSGQSNMKVIVSWFSVADLEREKKFYGDVLGLLNIGEHDGWAEFSHEKGGAAIGLSAKAPVPVEKGATVVLQVQDLMREYERLKSRDVKFEGGIDEVPGVVKIATFRDPSGNRLQIVQSLMKP
jgi:predicted enzyme related to lactoylglutathione lyase